MSAALGGLFCPVTTPFGADGRADPARLADQVAIYAGLGLAGVVLFGTSGEGPLLDDDEEPDLLVAARSAAPAGWRTIVQVGRESARAAARAARRAADGGADALLCLPPRYYPCGPEALAEYYRAVAAASDLPLLAYHIPQRTGVDLSVELLAGLAEEGVLSGIKDSAGDLGLQRQLRRRAGPGFAVLDGKAGVAADALRGGADGAILAVADAAPEAALRLFEAWRAGDEETLDAAQRAILPLAEAFGARFGVPGIKAALDARGWPGGGPPRPPLEPLGPAGRAAVADALRAASIPVT